MNLNAVCDGTDSASEQCSAANSECRDDGLGANKCLCSISHYDNGADCLFSKIKNITIFRRI